MKARTAFWAALVLAAAPCGAGAFCGFYVAKADASLYNKASQVVLARKGNRSVLSMMNDFEGALKDFAMVVPVPVVLKKGQIHVGERKLFDRIDAYSAPRLVEYFDEDPCNPPAVFAAMSMDGAESEGAGGGGASAKSLGVTVEAQYTVGEYDIVILSAKESTGLETWLHQEGYRIPQGARKALAPYIKQNLKFFVAKVNLKEQAKTGLSYLRPLQFAFETEKFMLPIRLGMINAKGPQELLIYVLTPNGRVETTNYRTVKLPSDMDLPVFVKNEFADFYRAMFDRQVKKEEERAVFTEYFWDMGWCDPCSADPLSPEELKALGVFWLDEPGAGAPAMGGGAQPVMVTRLHLRYRDENFPQDLSFQETSDRQNFQGRYVLRHPWKGEPGQCEASAEYYRSLVPRRAAEAENLAKLTGWESEKIRAKMGPVPSVPASKPKPPPPQDASPDLEKSWWEKMWQ